MTLLANVSSFGSAEENARLAPGATSWIFSSIARPSSVEPDGPSSSTSTGLLALRSPVLYESARPPAYWLTLSEITPTVTPVPSTLNWERATSANSEVSASL